MLNITTKDLPYDSTYFAMSDVSPEFGGETLTIFNGEGSRRSWGRPQVTTTIVINDDDLTAVHVGFSHKHRGGQGWFYFRGGLRVTWGQLSDDERQRVLSNRKAAPSWAKVPGKLRSENRKPSQNTQIAYKLVKVEGDRLLSLYDGETEYKLGKRLAQKAQEDHNGGYYAYESAWHVKNALEKGTLVPARCLTNVQRLALLKVEIGGTVIEYSRKVSATYLKPVEIVETFDFSRA